MTVIICIIILILVYIGLLLTIVVSVRRGDKDDVGRFKEMKNVYKNEAYNEVIQKCREQSQNGEVTYLSIEDIERIIQDLKA